MSDSLISRDEKAAMLKERRIKAKALRERRQRLHMARVFARHKRGVVQFLGTSESMKLAFASEEHMQAEIEWRRQELMNGAREY